MTSILLTGAGFSRNWGGWLVDEVHEYLLGCPELDEEARAALWRAKEHGGNFETALAEAPDGPRRVMFEKALAGMFAAMNKSLRSRHFEFAPANVAANVGEFLSRFDIIFTLNQDLLLERHYCDRFKNSRYSRRWRGSRSPQIAPVVSSTPNGLQPFEAQCAPANELASDPNLQPYVKLHGSSNWQTTDGGHLLIVGGNKDARIDADPLLASYWRLFRKTVCASDARLMVIGYSFRDAHVNRVLLEAFVPKRGLFIVDPRGVDVLDTRDARMALSQRPELFDLHPSVVGASRRALAQTFSGDTVEYEKLIRFVDEGQPTQ